MRKKRKKESVDCKKCGEKLFCLTLNDEEKQLHCLELIILKLGMRYLLDGNKK